MEIRILEENLEFALYKLLANTDEVWLWTSEDGNQNVEKCLRKIKNEQIYLLRNFKSIYTKQILDCSP